mmetsp:Transcript_133356/g.188400  ORF Transcript_133356/g.188400 Transcript_133356/m.188400 type:complete len:128 (+) Transcript_133356:76-459(+)
MCELWRQWTEVEVFCAGCRNQCDQKCVIDNHEVEILQGPLTEGGPSYAENCCQQMRPASIGSLSSAEMCSAKLVERNRTVSMSSRPGPEWSSETLSVLLSPRLLAFSLPEYVNKHHRGSGSHLCTTR